MPSHGIIPYRLGMREKGDRSNFWNLKNLYYHDNTLPESDIIDIFEQFLDRYHQTLASDDERERTFLVRDYNIDGDVVEGIVSTSDYGYESELRDVTDDSLAHIKQETEAELLPFYFLFWIPKTPAGQLYENGERGILVFQQINGGSVETGFSRRFVEMFLDEDQGYGKNTMFGLRPIMTQEVLDKSISVRQ